MIDSYVVKHITIGFPPREGFTACVYGHVDERTDSGSLKTTTVYVTVDAMNAEEWRVFSRKVDAALSELEADTGR